MTHNVILKSKEYHVVIIPIRILYATNCMVIGTTNQWKNHQIGKNRRCWAYFSREEIEKLESKCSLRLQNSDVGQIRKTESKRV